MSEQNKAIVRRIPEEITSQGKLELIDELFSPDFVDHTFVPELGLSPGREGIKQFISILRSAFPDIDIKVQDTIAEGDMVVVRNHAQGTHQGEFMGIPATGKHISWSEMHIVRFADGKLVEHWANVDRLGVLQQLGVVPS